MFAGCREHLQGKSSLSSPLRRSMRTVTQHNWLICQSRRWYQSYSRTISIQRLRHGVLRSRGLLDLCFRFETRSDIYQDWAGEDQRPQLSGALTEQPHSTGYEPNRLAEDWDYRHFTEDGQFTEHEDLRVRPLSFHQSIIASTFDSASRRLRNRTFTTNNFVFCWFRDCMYRSEKQVQNDRKFIERENLISSSSQHPKPVGTGKPVAVFSS